MSSPNTLKERLKSAVRGEVSDNDADLKRASRDTSIFEIKPYLVVSPRDAEDVVRLVRFVREEKEKGVPLSLTARAAGTDMTGGPLTSSIVVSFTPHMNRILEVGRGFAVAEPGVYYRDFEKETLRHGYILPSYPASKQIAALGGMVANDAGGELSLSYGKTRKYVEELDVVLSDGSKVILAPLSAQQLEEKKKLSTFEGDIYRNMHALIEKNRATIENARPTVSKNSSGYALWDVMGSPRATFDLTKLITGSQGTLALVTKIKLSLIRPKAHRAMLVVFLSDFDILPDVVHKILRHKPESFESYDEHTLSLAVRFMPQILKNLGLGSALHLAFSFLPEIGMVLTGGVPKLVLIAEFAAENEKDAHAMASQALASLEGLSVRARLTKSGIESEKYWRIRRESFALLRKNLKGLYASPFIDDIIVNPDHYPEFLPKLDSLLKEHALLYTIAGHIGNGNFHIIPLMDLKKPAVHHEIAELTDKVYRLVLSYGGSISAEHNDGLIRTPYLPLMFGDKMVALFEETKKIFDPLNIFNPGKKVGGRIEDLEKYMVR